MDWSDNIGDCIFDKPKDRRVVSTHRLWELAMRYCMVIQLEKSSDLARLRTDVPAIVALIKGYSQSDEMTFRSNDGVLFGWFIQTTKPVDYR